MTNDSYISRLTIYCEKDALKILREIIDKYKREYGTMEGGRLLGLKSRKSIPSNFCQWKNGRIALKHLKKMCDKTGYDIKLFFTLSGIHTEDIYTHIHT
jgi:hypothetical protein